MARYDVRWMAKSTGPSSNDQPRTSHSIQADSEREAIAKAKAKAEAPAGSYGFEVVRRY